LLDPEERMLEVYQLEGGRWSLLGVFEEEDTRVRAPPFDAVELELDALWVGLPARANE
jgi:hypothetical protein